KMFTLLYGILQTISAAIYTLVATVWHIQQALTNLMMATFLFALGLVCHPIMVIPMLLGGYYVLRNFYFHRAKIQRGDDTTDTLSRTPRLRSFRNIGNISSRSEDN
ncbi:hypothetical protein KR067_005463, partial [Drosophila pandora]